MIVRKKLNKLPNRNFIIHFDSEKEEYYGVEIDEFYLPKNIYGDHSTDINRYLKSFNTLDKNLGILLSGYKGSGKTLLAKQLMIEAKLPTLVIEEAFKGSKFNDFINSIDQEVIIFFDEFEKVYKDQEDQEELLTLFDGVVNSKKIFLLTANKDTLNEFFENRPSRIKYLKQFKTVDRELLDEIMEDLLKDSKFAEGIVDIVDTLGECGKDLIISLIEEINMSGDTAGDCAKRMNIKIPRARYDFVALLSSGDKYTGMYYFHPLEKESLKFSSWIDGFDYDEYVGTMKVEKFDGEIHLEDNNRNKFKFYKQTAYNALDNIN